MDFLELVWLKLATILVFWLIGSVVYFAYNSYPITHPYTTIAFGPAALLVFLPMAFYVIYFLFFVWE